MIYHVVKSRLIILLGNITALLLVTAPVQASTVGQPFHTMVAGTNGWAQTATKQPGDMTYYLMTYQNLTNKTQAAVSVVADSAIDSTTDAHSIVLYNPAYPKGTKKFAISSDGRGVELGVLKAGQTASVVYGLTLPAASTLSCGDTALPNTMTARVGDTGRTYSDTTTVTVYRACRTVVPAPAPAKPQPPIYTCDAFEPTTGSGGYVGISSLRYSAKNGAVYEGAVIDWGDGQQAARTKDMTLVSHSYAKNASYVITASLYFVVNGSSQRVVTCSKTLTISTAIAPTTPTTPKPPTTVSQTTATSTSAAATSTPPQSTAVARAATTPKPIQTQPVSTVTTLPNTGSGVSLAWLLSASIAGGIGYQLWLRRRQHG